MNRRAVFLDVDGTLVNERGLIPGSARRAVREARANGHFVFLCTGRSTPALWPDLLDVGFDGIIAAAGGYIEHAGSVIAHRTVPVGDLRRAVAYLSGNGIEYLLESNSGIYGSANSLVLLHEAFFGSVSDAAELALLQGGNAGFVKSIIVDGDHERADINKILFLQSETTLDTIRAEFAGIFDVVPASVHALGANSGELALAGVNKALAIEVLISYLGIARTDTIAFGDGFNDLEMLAYVQTGVAMGSANQQVLDVADDVTGSPDEDGIHAGFVKHGLI